MTTVTSDIASISLRMQAVDSLLIKALKISEVAQIARIEIQLRKYIWSEWESLRRPAAQAAKSAFLHGSNPGEIEQSVDRVMQRWEKAVRGRVQKDIEWVYYLSREAIWKKVRTGSKASLAYDKGEVPLFEPVEKAGDEELGANPEFNVVDRRAVEDLRRQQLFWIGEHYDKNVSDSIREVAEKVMLEVGLGRDIAGKMLQQLILEQLGWVKTPFGFGGSSAQYFEMVVANAVTTARAHGHLRSLSDMGVTRYEIQNPMDSRTCPVCSHMNGKRFTVDQGVAVMRDEQKAKNPQGIKNAHPWVSAEELISISPQPGNVGEKDSGKLASAGICIPPFHGRCRCVVTIVLDDKDLKRVFSRRSQ